MGKKKSAKSKKQAKSQRAAIKDQQEKKLELGEESSVETDNRVDSDMAGSEGYVEVKLEEAKDIDGTTNSGYTMVYASEDAPNYQLENSTDREISTILDYLHKQRRSKCLVFDIQGVCDSSVTDLKSLEKEKRLETIPFFQTLESMKDVSYELSPTELRTASIVEGEPKLNSFWRVLVFNTNSAKDSLHSHVLSKLLYSCKESNSKCQLMIKLSKQQKLKKLVTFDLMMPEQWRRYGFKNNLAVISNFISKYGSIVQTISTDLHNLERSIIIVDIKYEVLPPFRSFVYIDKVYFPAFFKVRTKMIYCNYCRCISHKTLSCPLLPTCTHCHLKSHCLLQCRRLTLSQRAKVFEGLPELFKHDLVSRYAIKPLWLRDITESADSDNTNTPANDSCWTGNMSLDAEKDKNKAKAVKFPIMYREECDLYYNKTPQRLPFISYRRIGAIEGAEDDTSKNFGQIVKAFVLKTTGVGDTDFELISEEKFSVEYFVTTSKYVIPPVSFETGKGIDIWTTLDLTQQAGITAHYCPYCRCTTHLKKNCPVRAPCAVCESEGHYLVQCPHLNNSERRRAWSQLPQFYRETVIARFEQKPMWLKKLLPAPKRGRK